MAKEIERKFLVSDDSWRQNAKGSFYRQGYLATVKARVVRVRTANAKGFITVKGVVEDITRLEYEYEIPYADAEEMLDNLCVRPLIEKHRYKTKHDGLEWEIDLFTGENQGLVLAEVELADENQKIRMPAWTGAEVSGDSRYYNVNLIRNPYCRWGVLKD